MGEFRELGDIFYSVKKILFSIRTEVGCSLVEVGVEERRLLLSSCVKRNERGGRGEYIFYCVFTERQ